MRVISGIRKKIIIEQPLPPSFRRKMLEPREAPVPPPRPPSFFYCMSVSLDHIGDSFAHFGIFNKYPQTVCLLCRISVSSILCLSFVLAETWCSRLFLFLAVWFSMG